METPESNAEFATVAEVAAMLRVTPMTVYRLIKAEKLTAIQVGRSIRIPAAEAHRLRTEGT